MRRTSGWIFCVFGGLLLVLVANSAVYSQDKRIQSSQQAPAKSQPAAGWNFDPANVNAIKKNLALPPAIQLGSEKLASLKTVSGWQYAIAKADIVLPRNGTCLVTCHIDVQSHVLTGYLTFRTARFSAADGTNESDDSWAMDVPVPISQGSASSTYAWSVKGGQTYRFGCCMLADRGFLGIDVYPSVSWICSKAD